MNSKKLTFRERISAVFIYIFLLISALWYLSGNLSSVFTEGTSYNYVLVSAGLLLIFGVYIAEPYFAKPTDVLVNLSAIILFVLGLPEGTEYLGRSYILYTSLFLLLLTIVVIFAKEESVLWRFSDWLTGLLVTIGQSKVSFSLIYLVTIYSFFGEDQKALVLLFTFWILFITAYWVEMMIKFISKNLTKLKEDNLYIGKIVGVENKCVYLVESDIKNKTKVTVGDLVKINGGNSDGYGVVAKKTIVLGGEQITVFILDTQIQDAFPENSAVYKIDVFTLEDDVREKVLGNDFTQLGKKIVGYVHPDSDLQKIKFRIFSNSSSEEISEGSIVTVNIRGKQVMYQILDATTREEVVSQNSGDTYFLATAKKLGLFSAEKREIQNVKWLPEMFAPVCILDNFDGESAQADIGVLPNTDYPIRIDNFNQLITHNTAILGILGVGKSCLTFELLQKVVANTEAKIVCLDVTNEYKVQLKRYIEESLICEDFPAETLKLLKANDRNGTADDPTTWGNVEFYKQKLDEVIDAFSKDETKKVLILNPDWHAVSKAGSQFKIQHKIDLGAAEKSRYISERIFIHAKNKYEADANKDALARFLIVYEEAHSLVPEWNSAANEGDQSAANGTARVILQGRKYGLGSFVITQRTANISKTILNQCNTIFALKVFDDTGKQFLENYVGSDYAKILSTLDDRHAVITGKAFNLKQPIVIKLNDRDQIMLPEKIE
jgi:uncharacterized protein